MCVREREREATLSRCPRVAPSLILTRTLPHNRYGFEKAFAGSFFITGCGMAWMNSVPDNALLYISIYGMVFAWSCYMLILGATTPLVPHEDAGRFQGAMYSVMTIGMLIGTYGSYLLYESTTNINYGASECACATSLTPPFTASVIPTPAFPPTTEIQAPRCGTRARRSAS